MARYDIESDVQFAEAQFAKAREYKEKQAKEQDKFAKRLLMFDTAARGVNYLINQRAQELEADMLPQKTQLNHIYNKAQDILGTQKIIDDKYNGNAQAYWTDFYKQNLDTYAADVYQNKNITSGGRAALLKQAEILGQQKALAWGSVLKEAQDIPTNIDDLQAKWDQYSKTQVPHNVFDWATKGLKNLFRGETKESIQQKSAEYRKNLLDSDMFKDFGELRTQYESFQKINPDLTDDVFTGIIEKYNEAKNEIPFFNEKIIGSPQVIQVPESVRGGTITKNKLLVMYNDENEPSGVNIIVKDTNINEFKPKPKKTYTESDLKKALSFSNQAVTKLDKNNPLFKTFNEISDKNKMAFADQVLETADSLIDKGYSSSTAQELASLFLLEQKTAKDAEGDTTPLVTIMTDFDVFVQQAVLRGGFDLEKDLLENISTYRDRALQDFGGNDNPEYFSRMHKFALEAIINADDLSVDTKNEFIRDLNKELGKDLNVGIIEPDKIVTTIPAPVTKPKEILSDEKVLDKYSISENLLNKLRSRFNISTYQTAIPFKEDLVDIVDKNITTEDLIKLGYLTQAQSRGPIFRLEAQRKFLKDLFTDLGQL